MRKIYLLTIVLISGLCLQGCMFAALGAGIGAVKYGGAKQQEAQAKNREAYNGYLIEMQKINLQRQKAALAPEPIMSFDMYIGKNTK